MKKNKEKDELLTNPEIQEPSLKEVIEFDENGDVIELIDDVSGEELKSTEDE